EHHDARGPDAGHVGYRRLEIRRMVLAALSGDQILRAPANVEVAVGEVAEIPCVQPAAAECLGRRDWILEVALHHRWAARDDCPHVPIGQRSSLVVHDSKLVTWKRPAAADEPHDLRRSVRAGHGDGPAHEALACDRADREAVRPERAGGPMSRTAE